MREIFEKAFRQIPRQELEELFSKIVPDLPEHLRNNLHMINNEGLAALVAEANERTILQRMKSDGVAIYVEKDPWCFGLLRKTNEPQAPSEVFNDDAETQSLCRAIPEFLATKDLANLSTDDNQEMHRLRELARDKIKNDHPDVFGRFSGFQLADNADGVVINLFLVQETRFSDVDQFINTLRADQRTQGYAALFQRLKDRGAF